MFTGIIEETGRLKSFDGGRIEIACVKVLEDVKIGDSINTNGICLTVTDFGDNYFAADVMPETVRRTSLEIGGVINLERAMKVGDRFGGHIVSGHIDGVGKIIGIRAEGNAIIFNISAGGALLKQIASKGSVALDGISLTVVEAGADYFSVSMIPHSRAVTNFNFKRVGSLVNIETDIFAKYIERMTKFKLEPELSREFLIDNGY